VFLLPPVRYQWMHQWTTPMDTSSQAASVGTDPTLKEEARVKPQYTKKIQASSAH
jgi:hypothetical protein